MKKRICNFFRTSALIALATVLWTFAGAQTSITIVPASPAPASDTTISYNGSQQKTYELSSTSGITNVTWTVLGDLEIVSSTSSQVTVRSKSRRYHPTYKGFGKGRVIATFDDAAIPSLCGPQSASQDIYKVFTPANLDRPTDEIVGPDCIKKGDTVTYSIESRYISVNADQNIGQDKYKWVLPHGISPTNLSADDWELFYFSSDSSSVTFLVGDVVAADTIITVDLGRANLGDAFKITKKLGEAAPAPVFKPSKDPGTVTCLPFNTNTLTFVINTSNVPAALEYVWDVGGWKVNFVSTRGDSIVITPGNNTQTIRLTSTGLGCADREDEFVISRSLTASNQIVPEGGSSCVPENTTLNFTVSGVPDGTKLLWTVPSGNGWSIPGGQINSTSPNITIGTTSDTIFVSTFDCKDAKDTLIITIKPNKPVFTDSTVCLVSGSTANLTYAINTVAHATGYSWSFPTGWTPVGSTNSTSVTVTPSGTTKGKVIAFALGCENNSDTLEVNFQPTKPGTITVTPTGACNNSGKKDTVSFSVNPVDGQHFHWLPIPGWIVISANADSSTITYQTDGTPGTYKAKVQGVSDFGCDPSLFDSTTTTIAAYNYQLLYNSLSDFYWVRNLTTMNSTTVSPCATCTYRWYIVIDGVVSADGDGEIASDAFRKYRAFTNGYGNVQDSTDYTIVIDIVESSGCVTRRTYGAPLSLNIPPSNFKTAAGNSFSEFSEEITIFPNPASDVLNVFVPKGFQNGELTIVNSGLQKVYHSDSVSSESNISTASFADGIYFVHLRKNGKLLKKKVIISKK